MFFRGFLIYNYKIEKMIFEMRLDIEADAEWIDEEITIRENIMMTKQDINFKMNSSYGKIFGCKYHGYHDLWLITITNNIKDTNNESENIIRKIGEEIIMKQSANYKFEEEFDAKIKYRILSIINDEEKKYKNSPKINFLGFLIFHRSDQRFFMFINNGIDINQDWFQFREEIKNYIIAKEQPLIGEIEIQKFFPFGQISSQYNKDADCFFISIFRCDQVNSEEHCRSFLDYIIKFIAEKQENNFKDFQLKKYKQLENQLLKEIEKKINLKLEPQK